MSWREELEEQGRSMTWLAEQVGTSPAYLRHIAAGRKNASPQLLARIESALHPDPRLAASQRLGEQYARRLRMRDNVAGTLRAEGIAGAEALADRVLSRLHDAMVRELADSPTLPVALTDKMLGTNLDDA